MTPIDFPEANRIFGAPKELAESQCMKISAYVGEITQGSVDGLAVVVVAWKPNQEDIQRMIQGHPIYLSTMGGLLPHFLTTDFHSATHPA